MNTAQSLSVLQVDFVKNSTNSMPIAGMITWFALGIAALFLAPKIIGTLAIYIIMAIMPIAFILDRLQGKNLFSGGDNPLTKMFLSSIISIALTVPLVITAANISGDANFIVLGMGILAGVIWIPYGWAADDPVGMRHAVGRAIGCYAAYAYVADPYKASAICTIVVLSYLYSLLFMKKAGQ